jgi:hypothetical protein
MICSYDYKCGDFPLVLGFFRLEGDLLTRCAENQYQNGKDFGIAHVTQYKASFNS